MEVRFTVAFHVKPLVRCAVLEYVTREILPDSYQKSLFIPHQVPVKHVSVSHSIFDVLTVQLLRSFLS